MAEMKNKNSKAFSAGDIIGKIEVLSGILPDKPHYHKCRCLVCKREVELNANEIRAAEKSGCGSCRKLATKNKREADAKNQFVGKKFGDLIVLDAWIDEAQRTMVCKCRCACGNEIVARKSKLICGNTKTCGHNTRKNLDLGTKFVLAESVTGTRISSLSQNLSKNNTSGHKGVSMVRSGRRAGLYRAYITFRRKQYNLGYYKNISDAVAARAAAEDRIFGDFLDWYQNNFAKDDKSNS